MIQKINCTNTLNRTIISISKQIESGEQIMTINPLYTEYTTLVHKLAEDAVKQKKFNSDSITISQEIKSCDAFFNKAKSIAKKMSAQYQAKKSAYERKNESFRSTGSLALNRVANYRTSDDIFHNKVEVRQGKNHGLIVIIDASGSMSRSVKFLAHQFLITALFCNYTQINYEIYNFTSTYRFSSESELEMRPMVQTGSSLADIRSVYESMLLTFFFNRRNIYEITERGMTLSQIFSKRMETKTAFGNMGGTPLLQATIFAYHRAKHMQENGIENVSITFMTDGFGDDCRISKVIKDPYSNRYFRSNDTNESLSVINKMIRLHNIKIFNIFVAGENAQKVDLKGHLLDYIQHNYAKRDGDKTEITRINKERYEQLKMIAYTPIKGGENILIADEVLFYNKFVVCTDSLEVKRARGSDLAKALINDAKEIQMFSMLGTHLNETICQDFA